MRQAIAVLLILLALVSGNGCMFAAENPNTRHIAQTDDEPKGPFARLRRLKQALQGETAEQDSSVGLRVRKVSPFGLHAVGMPFIGKLGDSGASIVRIIISGPIWSKLETDNGLDFSKLDKIVQGLQQNGIDLVITLDANSPKWGARHLFSKRGGGVEPTTHSDTPADTHRFDETLRAIAERYDNDGKEDMPGLAYSVDYYQIVNEWVWQWEGPERGYLNLLKDASTVIKGANPNAKIILGGLTGVEFLAIEERVDDSRSLKFGGMTGQDKPDIMTLDEFKKKRPGQVENSILKLKFILAEGKPYYDIIDLHSYTDTYKEMIPSIKILKRLAPGKEIWSMENAGPYYNYSPERHSQEMVKRYVSGIANGLKKIFWSSYNPTGGWSKNFLNLSLLDKWGNQRAAYHTYKFLTSNLDGLQSVTRIDAEAGVDAYRVITKSGELYLAWADTGAKTIRLKEFAEGARLQAVTIQVSRDQQINVEDVALHRANGQLEFKVSGNPVFVGSHIKRP